MKVLACCLGLLLVGGAAEAKSAGGEAMKACASQWAEKKAAKQTNGQTFRDFSKSCLSTRTAAAAPVAAPAMIPASAVAAAPTRPARPSILSRLTHHTATTTSESSSSSGPAAEVRTATPVTRPAVVSTRTASTSTTSIATSPAGATGQCRDGTYTHAVHHGGACSGHGGVAKWM